MTEESSNLRLLPVARDDDELIRTKPAERDCSHDQTEIDVTAHRLYCRACGQELDPLDFILRMTRQRERWRRESESLRAKGRLAHRELEEVERKVKNAKARLRRQGVVLASADARRARDQLRALGRALPNVLLELAGADDEAAVARAHRIAKLCGYRADDAKQALAALTKGLDE